MGKSPFLPGGLSSLHSRKRVTLVLPAHPGLGCQPRPWNVAPMAAEMSSTWIPFPPLPTSLSELVGLRERVSDLLEQHTPNLRRKQGSAEVTA